MGQAAINAATNTHTQLAAIYPGLTSAQIWNSEGMTLPRDNGGCPGSRDSNTCSGIAQSTWDFSHLLEPFTH